MIFLRYMQTTKVHQFLVFAPMITPASLRSVYVRLQPPSTTTVMKGTLIFIDPAYLHWSFSQSEILSS